MYRRGEKEGEREREEREGESHTDAVQVLLAHGARACLQTELGWTAAHFAAESGRLSVLRLLHVHHAPLDKPDHCGDTAQRIAQIYGHKECALFLKKAEAECQAYRKTAAQKGIKLDEDDEEWSRDAKENTDNMNTTQ
ncbi:hypothetical protein WMY93_016837 [Mugilogobius chulae]|uniref:Uncharacterized protein n=1 Tax=Mugilogobius chulae TaxID=88201 RepID=A0AAW0NLG5_9GOBI